MNGKSPLPSAGCTHRLLGELLPALRRLLSFLYRQKSRLTWPFFFIALTAKYHFVYSFAYCLFSSHHEDSFWSLLSTYNSA